MSVVNFLFRSGLRLLQKLEPFFFHLQRIITSSFLTLFPHFRGDCGVFNVVSKSHDGIINESSWCLCLIFHAHLDCVFIDRKNRFRSLPSHDSVMVAAAAWTPRKPSRVSGGVFSKILAKKVNQSFFFFESNPAHSFLRHFSRKERIALEWCIIAINPQFENMSIFRHIKHFNMSLSILVHLWIKID